MKKIIIALFPVLILSSCFSSETGEKSLKDLKEELLSGNANTEVTPTPSTNETTESTESLEENSSENTEQNSVSQKYLTEAKFLEFDSLSASDFASLEKEITGKTLVSVDKIIVHFSNPSSEFPDDSFQLRKFKAGDASFLYRAFKKYETLDYGENTYVFEAHSGETVSKLELKVTLEKEKKNQ